MTEKLVNKNKSTPVMRQYWDAKKRHPDSIMLFRMGDFYETFEKDAILSSKILGIALTKRANGAASSVPLAGFPHHSLEQYAHKLLSAGYKIALCEQVEDPKLSKGIVKRAVVEILTPGTAISSKYLDNKKNNFLISLIFKNNNVGYSIIDNSTGDFYCGLTKKYEIEDVIIKNEIKEIIVPSNQKTILDDLLKGENILITSYDDWKSDFENCYEKLCEQFNTKTLKGYGIDENELCVMSSGACLQYLENNYCNNLNHINSISFVKKEGFMRLDAFTIKNLEIFTSFNNSSNGTLFKTVNKTVTSQGSRLLSNNISNPLTNKKIIQNRLDLIDEVFDNEKLLLDLRNLLNQVSDIQRIVSKITNGKSNPRDILNLGFSLKINSKIESLLNKCKVVKLNKLVKRSKNTNSLSKKIIKVIKDNPSVNLLKGDYINSGINKKLDEYRNISNNVNQWLVDYQTNEKNKTNIQSLKIKYNKIFGYYIDITKTHLDKVPDNYIRKQTLVNSERFYTNELKEYEEKILNSDYKIVELEKEIFNQLSDEIIKNIDKILFNSKILAKIDVICSHALLANESNYVKPILSNKIEIDIKNSRHPVVEKLLGFDNDFISNDLYMNQKGRQIAIITGPNMAGKSTFLRQVAQTILLAQIGSFVPADSCKIGIVDQLFTRVGANDNIAEGESTFLVEMNESAYILNNATKNSFIILDEVGRGTSTFDGLSLAWSITEYLHNNKKHKARTLFATHYHELISLAEKLKDTFNLNVQIKEYNDEIIFMRKVVDGGADKSYGIQVAEMAGLPNEVIARSKLLLKKFLKDEVKLQKPLSKEQDQLGLFDLENKILNELKDIDLNKISPIEALNKLNELKNKYNL
tara:strand:+ start:4653 stop:7247 length:2595 start_codon:yes stop_codon:yes gene_type:complete